MRSLHGSDSGRAAPGWVYSSVPTPLKSPLVQEGTPFSSSVASQRGIKDSSENVNSPVDSDAIHSFVIPDAGPIRMLLLARNNKDTILKESVGDIDGDNNNALVFFFKKHPC